MVLLITLLKTLQVAVKILVQPNRQQDPLGLVPLVGQQILLIHAVEFVNENTAQVTLFFLAHTRISQDGTDGLVNRFALIGMKLFVNPLERGFLFDLDGHAVGNSNGSDSSSMAVKVSRMNSTGRSGLSKAARPTLAQ